MKQDWLQVAEEGLRRAREAREMTGGDAAAMHRAEAGGAATLVIKSVLPSGRRHNVALDLEASNVCDAVIIAAAQAEAQWTGQRESFMLPDGSIGSVDANGNLYDERPPQG